MHVSPSVREPRECRGHSWEGPADLLRLSQQAKEGGIRRVDRGPEAKPIIPAARRKRGGYRRSDDLNGFLLMKNRISWVKKVKENIVKNIVISLHGDIRLSVVITW